MKYELFAHTSLHNIQKLVTQTQNSFNTKILKSELANPHDLAATTLGARLKSFYLDFKSVIICFTNI